MADFELRPVAPDDEAALIDVYADGRAAELAAIPWADAQKREFVLFQYRAQIAHYAREYPEAVHAAVVVDGRVIGRLYVDRRPEEIRILDMGLLDGDRGLGIGGAIVRDLQEEALHDGKTLSVYVEEWQQSIGMFEHLGFERRETNGLSVLMVWSPDS